MGNKNPFFSIVIPTYNHGHLIKRCLDSILAQKYTDWEVIVVNNFSEDNTIEVVEAFHDSRIQLVNNPNHGVIAVSRNKGIELAKGEWICLLDSDDWYYPDKLEEILEYTKDFDIIYHDLDMYNDKGVMWGRKIKGRDLSGNVRDDLLVNGNGIPNSSVAVRAEIIKKVGGFSEEKELIAVEDSDCWIRIAEQTQRFKYIPKSLGGYWIGANISCSIKQIKREQTLSDRHIHKLNPPQQKMALRSLAYRQARIYHKLGMFQLAREKYRESLSAKYPVAAGLYCFSFFHITI